MTHDDDIDLTDAERAHFDRLMDTVIQAMPERVQRLFNQVPLVVEDYPAEQIIQSFELERRDELCGLHDGVPLTARSVEDSGDVPDFIMIYREGIIAAAVDEQGDVHDRELLKQIRITVLHEVGHHFGLDEDDLDQLGYA